MIEAVRICRALLTSVVGRVLDCKILWVISKLRSDTLSVVEASPSRVLAGSTLRDLRRLAVAGTHCSVQLRAERSAAPADLAA